jgi:ABC-2 type transport system ATP-binding protein
MRIVLGGLAADSGDVRWQGRPVGSAIRRRMGYMPEERGLYPRMGVGDQLTYLARLHGMDPKAAQRAMEHWTEVLGIAHRRRDEVIKLSLGNQQRVQLAAALVHNAQILVLDEPFSGLDPVAVDVMSTVLRAQADRGVPVMFSSHQLDLVERLCDRVGIIRDGEMVAVGDLHSLRRFDKTRWVVDGPDPGLWMDHVSGARVLSVEDSRTILEFEDGRPHAEQALLAAAMAVGPVREFGPVRPSLVDLYRDVVTSGEQVPAAAGVQP